MQREDLLRAHAERFQSLGHRIDKATGETAGCDHASSSLDLEGTLGLALKTAHDLVQSQSASIYLYEKRSRMLSLVASTNTKRQIGTAFSSAMGIVGRCFSRKTALAIKKPGSDHLFEGKADGKVNESADSMLCVPLLNRDHSKAIGVIQMVNRILKPRAAPAAAVSPEGSDDLHEDHSSGDLGFVDARAANVYLPSDMDTLTAFANLIASSIEYRLEAKHDEESMIRSQKNSALDLLNLLNSKLSGGSAPLGSLNAIDDDIPLDEPITMPEPPKATGMRKPLRQRVKQTIQRIPRAPVITIRQIKAATKIQAGCRGWQIRRLRYLAVLRQERDAARLFQTDMATVIQALARGYIARLYVVELRHAVDLIGRTVFDYICRQRERKGDRRTLSPKAKRSWLCATTKLVQAKARKRASRRIMSIQKIFRGHRAKPVAATPSRMHHLFSKLQARYRGFVVRKKILHEQAVKRDLASPTIVRLKTNQSDEVSPMYKYPCSTHVGLNQYLSLHRRDARPETLLPFFEASRGGRPPPHLRPPALDTGVAIAELSSRRLITAVARPATTPLKKSPTKLPSVPTVRRQNKPPRTKPRYQLDVRHVYGLKAKLTAVAQPTAPLDPKDERCYGAHRSAAFHDVLHVAARLRPAPTRSVPSPAFFACLVTNPKHHRDEATRRAIVELQKRYMAHKLKLAHEAAPELALATDGLDQRRRLSQVIAPAPALSKPRRAMTERRLVLPLTAPLAAPRRPSLVAEEPGVF
ncbi:hypothetical protein ACHHYP_09546 [Achlya hypogyna]|uniref:GAF domain-containing protein n=1 Tax=Achlya hypogyna TaxID=1202772 RepID=A0A1V9YN38_ACHHY|nr:hypothetical protein ACHHYP_09546 [Achlya hypogyna]